jgi:hypothetical protein
MRTRTLISIILASVWGNSFAQTATLDTTWRVGQEVFRASLKLDSDYEKELNTNLEITKDSGKVITDSIFSSRLFIQLKDVNHDNYTDLLVYQSSGARSNGTFNLYLYQPTTGGYVKVEGFNDWPNLWTTEADGILAASILTGTVEYRFFHLTDEGKLVDLDISERDSLLDGKAYDIGLLRAERLIARNTLPNNR